MLAKNVLGVIIAVICIAAFILFITRLVNVGSNQESDNAKNVLDTLLARVNALEDGQSNSFAIRGLDGWFLAGWSKDVSPREKPQKCLLDSCVCICKGELKDGIQKVGVTENVIQSCQEGGFCRNRPEKDVSVVTPFSYYGDLGFANSNKVPVRRIEQYIPLSSTLLEINISKDSSSVTIMGPYRIQHTDFFL